MTTLLCPRCETSSVVRAAVFEGAFGERLAVLALPLLILAALLVLWRVGGALREESS